LIAVAVERPATETIPGLTFENVRKEPLRQIWLNSPSCNAYRGTEWLEEPCLSCEVKEVDWGGCRCQALALALAGDPKAADPVCVKSPLHSAVTAVALSEPAATPPAFVRRNYREAANRGRTKPELNALG
jgi:PqqA peptide cyclase